MTLARWNEDELQVLLDYLDAGCTVESARVMREALTPRYTPKQISNKLAYVQTRLNEGASRENLLYRAGRYSANAPRAVIPGAATAPAGAKAATGVRTTVCSPFDKADGQVVTMGATATPASAQKAKQVSQLAHENELLRAEIDALRTRAAPIPQAAIVQTVQNGEGYSIESWQDTESAEVKWRRAEEDSEHRIQNAMRRKKFTVNFEDDWVMVAFMSDLHIAPGTPTALKRMREDAELISATPRCFVMLAGDMVDNHIKHRAAALAARSQPGDQWAHFEHLLELMQHKVVAAVAGNHDLWTDQIAGVDMLQRIFQSGKGVTSNIAYGKYQAYIDMVVGDQKYKVGMIHQYRMNSSYNQTHAVKQWLRMGEEDFDVGVIGHNHEAAIEAFIHRQKICWACRPGAYQTTSSYSEQYGWNTAIPTCPTFVFRGDMRSIIGFVDLREALSFCELQRHK